MSSCAHITAAETDDAHGALGFFDAEALAQRLQTSSGDYSGESKIVACATMISEGIARRR